MRDWDTSTKHIAQALLSTIEQRLPLVKPLPRSPIVAPCILIACKALFVEHRMNRDESCMPCARLSCGCGKLCCMVLCRVIKSCMQFEQQLLSGRPGQSCLKSGATWTVHMIV